MLTQIEFSFPNYSVEYNSSTDLSGKTIGGSPGGTVSFRGVGVSGSFLTYTVIGTYYVIATSTVANYFDVSASSVINFENRHERSRYIRAAGKHKRYRHISNKNFRGHCKKHWKWEI